MTTDTPKPLTCGECLYFDHEAVVRENEVVTADWCDHDSSRCKLGAVTCKDAGPCRWGSKKDNAR